MVQKRTATNDITEPSAGISPGVDDCEESLDMSNELWTMMCALTLADSEQQQTTTTFQIRVTEGE